MSVLSVAEERFLVAAGWKTDGTAWFDPVLRRQGKALRETMVAAREALRIQLERQEAAQPKRVLPEID